MTPLSAACPAAVQAFQCSWMAGRWSQGLKGWMWAASSEWLTCVVLAFGFTLAAGVSVRAETRTLKLYFIHTKERAEITFKRNGRYDQNGLKQINDNLGHLTGDDALRDTAEVLRKTFRGSDIVARLGGDEFVALAHLHSARDIETLCARLREQLREFNASRQRPYQVDLSIGATLVDGPADLNLEEFIARADEAMYQEKRAASGRHS